MDRHTEFRSHFDQDSIPARDMKCRMSACESSRFGVLMIGLIGIAVLVSDVALESGERDSPPPVNREPVQPTEARMIEPIVLEYAPFPAYTLDFPIEWADDPFGAPLWCHHLLSLRWLRPAMERMSSGDAFAGDTVRRVLSDFVVYHVTGRKPVSPYFASRQADHTLAIRMELLADAVGLLRAENPSDGALIADILRMLSHHLKIASGQELYRPGTNHGLMLDHSMLYVCLLLPELDSAQDYAALAESRALAQLEWLFTDEGVTREHSISYQEYNTGICMDILETCRRFDHTNVLAGRLAAILRQSQLLLCYAIKPDGEFPMVGDSFPMPKQHYYDRMRSLLGGLDSELEYGLSRGRSGRPPTFELLAFPDAGFGILRQDSTAEGSSDLAHSAFTAGWHSHVHKQEDDLSFTFYALGRDILIDPGYSDAFSKTPRGQWVRTAAAHSVVTSRSAAWVPSSTPALFGTTRLTGYAAAPGVLALRGEHRRIPATKVVRILAMIRPRLLFVVDLVESEEDQSFQQSLHLAPGISSKGAADGSGLVLFDRATGITLGSLSPLTQPDAILVRQGEGKHELPSAIVARRNEFLDSTIVTFEKRGRTLVLPALVQAASGSSGFVSDASVHLRGQQGLSIRYQEAGKPRSHDIIIRALSPGSGPITYPP